MMQIFDSWAHYLSPRQYEEYNLVFVEKVVRGIKKDFPGVPLIFLRMDVQEIWR